MPRKGRNRRERMMEQSAPFELVAKLEVAERQLRVAIRLFFERRDMIAVHTLAAAARGVLRDLGRRKGFMSIFEEGIINIRPEKQDEFKRLIVKPQNFFKHADKDPDGQLKFFFEVTQFHLFDATRLLVSLTGHYVPETVTMLGFFVVKYPALFNFDGMPELQKARELVQNLNPNDFDTILNAIDHLKLPA
jgi:hypothetical protein